MTIKHLGLLTFVIISIVTAQLSEMRVVGTPKEEPAELIGKDNRDANGVVCAGLIIYSDLVGLSYQANNGIVKVNKEQGKDLLFLSPDEKMVEVYCKGYSPLKIILNEVGIRLKSGQTWSLKLTGDKKLDLISFSIIVKPIDASITIDGVKRGTSQTHQVSPGKHTVTLEKEGYKSISATIEVTPSNILFNYSMIEVEVEAVKITSIPQGAKIVVNNSERGETDKGIFLFPGKYSLRLSKEGYVEVNTSLDVKENSENKYSFTLEKNSGLLHMAVSPSDAKVFINNEDFSNRNTLELLPGTYSLRVEKNGYLTKNEEIEIVRGKTLTKEYTIEKNSGILLLKVNPADAQVFINNADYSDKNSVELLPGKYSLRVEKNGYLPQNDEIEIVRGKTHTKEYTIEKNSSMLLLKVNPVDAEVFINKEPYTGRTTIELAPARYKIEVKKTGYYDQDETIDLQRGSTIQKVFSLTPQVGLLQFSVTPLDAKAQLMQNGIAMFEWEGMKVQKGIIVGEYELVCSAKGFKTLKKKILIAESKTNLEEITLQAGSDFTGKNSVGMELVFVEGGTFQMGGDGTDEKPIHTVSVSDFYIGKYEVTQKQWQDVMGNNPSNKKGGLFSNTHDYPVEGVSWNDIQEFLQKLNAKEGSNKYRLPTEAEWEYAARGGNKSKGYKYCGSNDIDEVAWYDNNSEKTTHKVGAKLPNELGIYDMSGNVWEWSNDRYGSDYYQNGQQSNPTGSSAGSSRALRGGSWYDYDYGCQVPYRYSDNPDARLNRNGFRILQKK